MAFVLIIVISSYCLGVIDPILCADLISDFKPISKQEADSLIRFIICGSKTIDYVPALEIADLLASTNFEDRACAAKILSDGKDVDTTSALSMLVHAIDQEIKTPLSNAIIHPYSFPVTQCLRQNYIDAIALLLENNISKINSLADSVGGEFKTRLILKMSEIGDVQAHAKAREILQSGDDGYLKLLAANTMNKNPDTLDIPVLISHLNDDFNIVDRFGNKSYNIRAVVACALIQQGYTIDRIAPDYQENVITKEPNK
jgi:hypothetical protein